MPLPDGSEVPMGVRSRRITFESALRSAALARPASRCAAVTSNGVSRRNGPGGGAPRVDGRSVPPTW